MMLLVLNKKGELVDYEGDFTKGYVRKGVKFEVDSDLELVNTGRTEQPDSAVTLKFDFPAKEYWVFCDSDTMCKKVRGWIVNSINKYVITEDGEYHLWFNVDLFDRQLPDGKYLFKDKHVSYGSGLTYIADFPFGSRRSSLLKQTVKKDGFPYVKGSYRPNKNVFLVNKGQDVLVNIENTSSKFTYNDRVSKFVEEVRNNIIFSKEIIRYDLNYFVIRGLSIPQLKEIMEDI